MDTNNIQNKLYSCCTWGMKLVFLNLVWLFFSACGLFVLGLFPATVAMFSVTRKWMMKRTEDVPFFRVFIATYKEEFWKANRVGWLLSVLSFALYIDFIWVQSQEGILAFYMYCLLVLICLFYMVTLLYLIPLYVHMKLSFFQYVKQSLVVVFMTPFQTLKMLGSILLIGFFFMVFPGLILFLAGSLFSFIVTAHTHRTFNKLALHSTITS